MDIHFRFGRGILFPNEIARVRDRVSERRIAVQYDSALSGIAKYVHPDSAADGNTLKAGFTAPTSVWDRALIVHEAVHAAFDVRAVISRSREAEAVAYVAQAIYLIKNRQSRARGLSGKVFAHTPLSQFSKA